MPTNITFKAIVQDGACFVPNDDGVLTFKMEGDKRVPDLTIGDIDPSEIIEYTFVNQDRNLGLSIRAKDLIQTFALTTDDFRQYNGDAYALAQAVAFAEVYATTVSWRSLDGDGAKTGAMPAVTREALCELPEGVLRAYYALSNKGVSLASLKKRPTTGTPQPPSEEVTI